MRSSFPMRNTFDFDDGVKITSKFESGNLWQCREFNPQTANEIPLEYLQKEEQEEEEVVTADQTDENGVAADTTPLFASSEDELYCYDLWVCPDSLPYVEGIKQRAQFHFSLTGLPA